MINEFDLDMMNVERTKLEAEKTKFESEKTEFESWKKRHEELIKENDKLKNRFKQLMTRPLTHQECNCSAKTSKYNPTQYLNLWCSP